MARGAAGQGRRVSDEPFHVPMPPMMSPEKARDIARLHKGFADQLRDFGQTAEAARAERQSQWWMTYSIALAQTKRDDAA